MPTPRGLLDAPNVRLAGADHLGKAVLRKPWLSLRCLIASPSARLFWSMSMPTGYVLDYPRWLHIWCHQNEEYIVEDVSCDQLFSLDLK